MRLGVLGEAGLKLLQAGGVEVAEGPCDARVCSVTELLESPHGVTGIVVVATEAPVTVGMAARLFRLGAHVITPAAALRALGSVASTTSLADRFLAWASAGRLTGLVKVLADTPLEGVAMFDAGALRAATFCGLHGAEALAEMLAIEDTEPTLEASRDAEAKQRMTIVLAEDDQALNGLLTRVLESAGYRVLSAQDGLEALTLVQRFPTDLVVSDIDMPRLDGWGLLRTLRTDPNTRELPVVLLSAYEDAVGTLKAAKAGARAYLKKSGRSREVLDTVSILVTPRRTVKQAVLKQRDFEVVLPAVGAQWVLSQLAEYEATGTLELEDELGRYEVIVSKGALASATAQNGSLRVDGTAALEALVTSRGTGTFSFRPAVADPSAPSVFTALEDVQRGLLRFGADRARELLESPRRLRLNHELSQLYRRAASSAELRIIKALEERHPTLGDLATRAEVDERQAERILLELLKRGIAEEDVRLQ